MARKAAEEALVRHYSHLLAADPEQEYPFRKTFDNAVQRAGVKHLTTDPADPGTFYEALQWPAKQAEGAKKQTLTEDVTKAQGLLREAAWLAAGQHGFAALAGLPELQAIIRHTCLPVLQRYACSLEEYTAADAAKHAGKYAEDDFVKQMKSDLNTHKGPLLAHLNPHLRVCLLAEVAAGLLVPGQPLPPDTIEHAAALYAFIDAARDKLDDEMEQQPKMYSTLPINSSSSSSSNSRNWRNPFSEPPLTKALTKLQVSNPSSPKEGTKSDLAPHADLLLQPPPHLLLELLLLQLQGDESGRRQFQQRYELDQEQMEGLGFLMAADESFAWMNQIAQQVQQQQQGPDHDDQQQQAIHLSSCNGSTANEAAATAGVWQVLGQVHQQRDSHPRTAELLQQLPAATDAAGLAANLVQLLAQGSICPRDGSAALEQSTCRQVVQQLRVLGGGLVLQFVSAARAAGGPAWQQEVPLQAVLLLGALEQLQGLALAYLDRVDVVHAAAAVSSSARHPPQRQRHHPCNKLQANGKHAKSPSGASSPTLEQQQQQQPCAAVVSSDEIDSDSSSGSSDADVSAAESGAAATAGAQGCISAALMRVARKAQDLLQLLRRFREANAAFNAAAEADPCAAAVAACDSLPVRPTRGLAACELFSAASPMLRMFPEPCGYGIWAPAVLPAAAAAAVDALPHAMPFGSSSWAVDGGSSSSNSSSGLPWFESRALAALAGAGVLAQRAHVLLSNLHTDLAAGDLQEQIAAEVVHEMKLKQRWSKSTLLQQQQQSEQQDLSEELQQLHEVCQQHGVDPHYELLLQLQVVRPAVLDTALRRWQHVADAAGVDYQQCSSYLYGWNRRPPLAAPGEVAIKAGKQALWSLYTQKAVEMGTPLLAWQDACDMQQKTQVLASLAGTAHAAGSSSSSSSGASDSKDPLDDGRFCASCKLCQAELRRHQEEQELEQQHDPSSSSSSSSSSSTGAASLDTADPFMWRRLVWGLLGRLKRSARRLYAAEKAMCPHADNNCMWGHIMTSLKMHLWSSSSGGDSGLAQVLLVQDMLEGSLPSRPRSFFVRHFARTVNLAFAQGYTSPAAALLSHQVLLVLSPLHQQQLPQPELAALLPSSFSPVVGKLLMQQLGLGDVLQEFQHESAGQPLMWHVWWHIGVRRYHWVKQQQKQQQGQTDEGQPQASSSKSAAATTDGGQVLSRLSAAELEALYKDPAAKYYAVGFAARQLCPDVTCLKPAAASSSSRDLTLLEGLASQLLAACKLTYMHVLHAASNSSEASSCDSAAAAATAADAVCTQQRDDAQVCVSMANALRWGAVDSNKPKKPFDSLDDLDLDPDLDLYSGRYRQEVQIAKSWIASTVIAEQQRGLAERCGNLKHAGGLREMLCCAFGAAERSSGIVQAALLVPAPVELWVAPAQWCATRAALSREQLCSQCEQPHKALRRLLEPAGWQTEAGGPRAGDSYCDSCGAFYFCDKQCAGKCWRWHDALCKPLSEVRQRYQRLPVPQSTRTGPLECKAPGTYTADDSSSDSGSSSSGEDDDAGYHWMDACSSSVSGYQWPVLQLLQQGSRHSWGEQCIVDEAGPLGLNCCGLLDSHHVHDASLVQTPHAAWSALKHAHSVRDDGMRRKATMLGAYLSGLTDDRLAGIGDY